MNDYKVFTSLDKKKWSDFVSNHPHGNIFQTPEMYEVYKRTKKFEPQLVAVADNERMLGLLLAVIQKEYTGPLGYLTARSIIVGGPLVENNDQKVLDSIIEQYEKLIKRKAIYSQFRNLWQQDMERNAFEGYGFEYEDHLNILVDLTKSDEQLWNEVNSKRKNKIRRALKENAYFSVEESDDSLPKSYAILKEVYGRAKLPLPDYEFFLNLKSSLTGESKLHIFTAKYNGEIIGCMLALGYKNVLYDFYAGAYSEYYKKYPNDLIPWEVFRWAKQNGYTVFDFGGAGKPGVPYGVRDYKKKFGGAMVELGRYEKVHKPALMELAKLGLKVWQKMKYYK